MKIVEQITKHIIPFSYETDFANFISRFKDDKNCTINDDIILKHSKLNDYVAEKFQTDKNYLRRISLLPSKDSLLYSSYNERRKTSYNIKGGKDKHHKFTIENIDIFAFSMNIGFLVIDYSIPTKDLNEFIRTTYTLKQSKRKEFQEIQCKKQIGKNEYKQFNENLKEFYETIFVKYGLQDQGLLNNEFLHFNSVLVDECSDESEFKKKAALVSKGFKQSYKITEKEIEEIVDSKFSNIFWGHSIEGVSCFASLSEDESTNEFLKGNLFSEKGNLNKVYFLMYLMLLNQRYSVLTVNKYIENKFINNELNNLDNYNEYLKEIKTRVANINIYHIYNNISYNSLYNSFYKNTATALEISSLIEEYKTKIIATEQIQTIMQIRQTEIAEERALLRERKIKKYEIFGLIIAVIVFVPALVGIVSTILTDFGVTKITWPLTFISLILCTTFAIIYKYIVIGKE